MQANSGFFGGLITRDQPRSRSPAQLTLMISKRGTPNLIVRNPSLHCYCSLNSTHPVGKELLFKVLRSVLGFISWFETRASALEGSRVLSALNIRGQFKQRELCIDSLGFCKGHTSVMGRALGFQWRKHSLFWSGRHCRHVAPVTDGCFFRHREVVGLFLFLVMLRNWNKHAHQRNSCCRTGTAPIVQLTPFRAPSPAGLCQAFVSFSRVARPVLRQN